MYALKVDHRFAFLVDAHDISIHTASCKIMSTVHLHRADFCVVDWIVGCDDALQQKILELL